jgi:hypothetical protein
VFPKVFLLLQDIQAGNRNNFTRPDQLLPDRKKLTYCHEHWQSKMLLLFVRP